MSFNRTHVTGDRNAHGRDGVSAAARATRLYADVGSSTKQVGIYRRISAIFAVFVGPNRLGILYLAEVSDADVLAAVDSGLDESRDSYGRDEADNGHHNHDFDKGESEAEFGLNFHCACWLGGPGVRPAHGLICVCVVRVFAVHVA